MALHCAYTSSSENNLRADAIFAQASDFIGHDWLE